jgi:outer membrane protein
MLSKSFFVLLAAASALLAQGGAPVRLTLQDAEAMALKSHPQVLGAQDAISGATEKITDVRSAYYPVVNGELTGSQANTGARIGAGYLTVSRLFDRFGTGITVDQLITDSGRTPNLVAQARLQENATEQDYNAARYDVLAAVNAAYFRTLRAKALVRVAQETVSARQTVVTYITSLEQNKLRSELDVSLVQVNLAQAQLLLLNSQNELQAAYAQLTRALGSEQPATYDLAEIELPPSPPPDVEVLVAEALRNRPELASLRLSLQAANRFEQAEKDLSYPTVSLLGVAGYMPYVQQITAPRLIPGEYAGAGINVQIPIFNGFQFTARRQEAHSRALEADQKVRDREQQIIRDVREAWAGARTAYQRIDVTAQMLRESSLALDLARGRYDLGLANIVELTQSQLNVTDAEVQNLSAKYDYQALYANLQYTVGLLR